jgi:leader peptidase (prepilin peptidase)/N-methyltransferase
MSPLKIIALGVLVLILLPIIAVDVRERRIPNLLNALLAVVGFGFQLATAPTFRAALASLIAPVAIIAVFLGLILAMKLLRRRGTLGLGDVKFLAAASIWVGFVGSTLVFVVASLLALLFTLARIPWQKADFRAAIPFSPFLAAGLALIFALDALAGPAPPTLG